jgi:hypothetical protein
MPCIRAACAAACLAFALLLMPSLAAAQQFNGDLDPAPHDNSMRDNVVGSGTISAVLAGNSLSITGQFSGLSSPATEAHLKMGAAMGVPGATIAELSATHAASGQITGTVALNGAEIIALKKGALYVQLDSANAPDGNSWAWLQNVEGP